MCVIGRNDKHNEGFSVFFFCVQQKLGNYAQQHRDTSRAEEAHSTAESAAMAQR